MKKIRKSSKLRMQNTVLCFFAFIIVIGALFGGLIGNRQHGENWNIISDFSSFNLNTDYIQIFGSDEPQPRSMSPFVVDRPADTHEGHIYTGSGERLGFIPEAGMVITERGNAVTINDPNNPGVIITFDEERQEFIDSANRALAIFLDSQNLDRRYLVSGGKYLREINLDTRIYLVNLRQQSGGSIPIYVSINRIDRGFFAGLVGPRISYRFYDMNGTRLNNTDIVGFRPPSWWRSMLNLVTTITTGLIFDVIPDVQRWRNSLIFGFNGILEVTTLRDLMELISHATEHPWNNLRCQETNQLVRTADDREVKINPRTGQLTSWAGFALWDTRTGFPIVFHDNEVWRMNDTSRQRQEIEDGTLKYSMTVNDLLNTGQDFYIGLISNPWGTFNVPLLNMATGDNYEDWRFLNGDRAQDYIHNHVRSRRFYPTAWNPISWFGSLFNFGGLNWLGLILRIFIIAIVLMLLSIPTILVWKLVKKARG